MSAIPAPIMPPGIQFTLAAAQKVYELIKEEGNFDLKLRAYIVGGGCSGFQYGFTFDETVNPDDQIIEKEIANQEEEDEEGEGGQGGRVQLLVDPMSFQYLAGAEIDYTEGVEGAQFVIRNPNAQTTCGCGSSFSV
ncbi:MAG TPA: iron-sulfur cluster insertion protein ErpA [Gammaproteobacteria bacterium]|nr:iron-sulfur cluster insertion protein ErpA [Gammaproteobacteria bacterium]